MARLPYAGYHIDKQPAEESTGVVRQETQKSPELGGLLTYELTCSNSLILLSPDQNSFRPTIHSAPKGMWNTLCGEGLTSGKLWGCTEKSPGNSSHFWLEGPWRHEWERDCWSNLFLTGSEAGTEQQKQTAVVSLSVKLSSRQNRIWFCPSSSSMVSWWQGGWADRRHVCGISFSGCTKHFWRYVVCLNKYFCMDLPLQFSRTASFTMEIVIAEIFSKNCIPHQNVNLILRFKKRTHTASRWRLTAAWPRSASPQARLQLTKMLHLPLSLTSGSGIKCKTQRSCSHGEPWQQWHAWQTFIGCHSISGVVNQESVLKFNRNAMWNTTGEPSAQRT